MSTIPPPWGTDSKWTPSPPGSHLFQPGQQSANPAGRPKGIVDKRMRLTKLLDSDADAVVKKAIELAKAGDPQVLGLVLARVAPTLKPVDDPVDFTLDTTQTLEQQGLQVLNAIAEGRLTPSQGKSIMDLVRGIADLRNVDTLSERVAALEAQLAEGNSSTAPGGVQQDGDPV